MAPAIHMPEKIHSRACLKSILEIEATSEPVQAPVIGSGMATSITSPSCLYLSTTLPRRRASSSSQLNHRLKMPILFRRWEIALKNSRSRGTGIRLPMIASNRAYCQGRWNIFMATGSAPRSSSIGSVEMVITISSLGNPRLENVLRTLAKTTFLSGLSPQTHWACYLDY